MILFHPPSLSLSLSLSVSPPIQFQTMAATLSSIFNIHPHSAIRFNYRLISSSIFIFSPRLPTKRPFRALDFSRKLSHNPVFNDDSKNSIPSFHHFLAKAQAQAATVIVSDSDTQADDVLPKGRIYQETYGCQMNVNDMEIVLSVMKKAGYEEIVNDPESAEIIFINTCAIRDNAEQRVWQRLNYFWFLKRHWKSNVATGRSHSLRPPKVVVLGCMAERLKDKILDADKMVDVVCGPDAYRDLPRLLQEVDNGQKGINTLLSLEETYADISPVRISKNSISAFVSVMRGCNNMCSFCIVPFTRGRERSRPVESIVKEVAELEKEGVKEVTLLGQNVNSYNDAGDDEVEPTVDWKLSDGFSSKCKVKKVGLRFADLLDRLSLEFPEIRFRYTSPHPKDFPDELLYIMRDRHNVCKNIHLPAQSGNSNMLERMRRGYTREAYLELVSKIRSIIPDVGLTSDFICGFCEETEEEHQDTLSLVRAVGYDMAYMFAYSMREKTHAHRNYTDNVPEEVKQRRLTELIEAFRESTGCDGDRVPRVGDYVHVKILKSSRASLFGAALGITTMSSFYNVAQQEAVASL
ncbi:putative tRNA-2-methylthio-N(6)-dimethylallyladenosine synthase [Helianthus annuus]|nr:putative tRNA-2-methylthio-N(6)-dimethylallyladenosine synthase [Helianthus annuus]KAJ0473585.1 putative tRNA-2-methylthio-N(6)-dimethylallyladenosine synthase [Helianthus annuus]KAJ0652963.1 putative tRNA-2-methylthio-N(6)-dimethylallyladenosine synthase [Helianthus annuus]